MYAGFDACLLAVEGADVHRPGLYGVDPVSDRRQVFPSTNAGDGTAPFDMCHVTRYIGLVIRSFADKRTEQLWVNGTERRLPPDIARRAVRRLSAVDAAMTIDDLRVPPGNRLHALEGDRTGQHAVSINDQWRVCFRFDDGDAYEVEVCDYH